MALQRPTGIRRQIGISLGVVAVLSVTGFVMTRKAASQPHEAAAPTLADAVAISHRGVEIASIEAAKVLKEILSSDIHATGQVLYSTDETVKISPRLTGRVKEVFVKVGDHVVAGQQLALLDSVDAATAQTTARQNENKLRLAGLTLERNERLYRLGTPEVTSAQSALDQARAGVITVRDSLDRTKQQAAIGGFTQPPVEAAQNSVITAKTAFVQAQSDLAQAQRDRDRKAKLVEIGVSATADLEAADNVLEKARTAVQSDRESVKLAEQALDREQKAYKTNLYAEQQVRTAEASYRQAVLLENAAARSVRLARAAILSTLQQAQSDLQTARTDVQNSRRVLELLGHPGVDPHQRKLGAVRFRVFGGAKRAGLDEIQKRVGSRRG